MKAFKKQFGENAFGYYIMLNNGFTISTDSVFDINSIEVYYGLREETFKNYNLVDLIIVKGVLLENSFRLLSLIAKDEYKVVGSYKKMYEDNAIRYYMLLENGVTISTGIFNKIEGIEGIQVYQNLPDKSTDIGYEVCGVDDSKKALIENACNLINIISKL